MKYIADHGQLTAVSVGYRLAPEDPFPAGPEDCYDAAEWLVDNAKEKYGNELMFTGGEVSRFSLVANGSKSDVAFQSLPEATLQRSYVSTS